MQGQAEARLRRCLQGQAEARLRPCRSPGHHMSQLRPDFACRQVRCERRGQLQPHVHTSPLSTSMSISTVMSISTFMSTCYPHPRCPHGTTRHPHVHGTFGVPRPRCSTCAFRPHPASSMVHIPDAYMPSTSL